MEMPIPPNEVMVTVKTEEGDKERFLDPLQIDFIVDRYQGLTLYLMGGQVWTVKENMKELTARIRKANQP